MSDKPITAFLRLDTSKFMKALGDLAKAFERVADAWADREFRLYARRSGEVVCERSHEDITACGGCGARV